SSPRRTSFPYTTLFRSGGNPVPARPVQLVVRGGLPRHLGPHFFQHALAELLAGQPRAADHEEFVLAVLRLDELVGDFVMILEVRSEEHTSELQSPDHLV